jgi:GT2 family glycosyltransferase
MKPFASIIILNYNGLQHLDTVLRSVEKQAYPREKFEIILADNASTDSSCAFVRENYPKVRIINFSKNFGFAEGNNLAAKQAEGEVLAFLNNDTEADSNWLAELLAAYKKEPRAMYGSQAFNFKQRNVSANSIAFLMAWGIPTNINVYRPRNEIKTGIFPSLYADAAGMLIGKNFFEKLNGFDKSYFAYEEEKDLGWKGWMGGIPSYVVTSSVYYHKGGSTLGEHSAKAIFLLWRNGLRNLVKYERSIHFIPSLLLHTAFSFAVWIKIFIPMHRGLLLFSMLRAYFRIVIDLPKLFSIRRKYKKTRKGAYSEMRKKRIILNLFQSLKYSKTFIKRRQEPLT